MVNFVVIVDPKVKRRSAFIRKIKPLISPIDGLFVSTFSNEDLSVAWAAGSWTPISHLSDSEGCSMICGDAIRQQGSERITAKQLRLIWNNIHSDRPDPFDGFHIAFVYRPDIFIVGADLLGLFPVYYYVTSEVILVGSSPELFRHHPCFETE